MDEQVNLLGRLTKMVAATEPEVPFMQRLCLALVEISGLDGGSMSIGFAAPNRTTLCATDRIAERIEELQDLTREGPALDAHREGRVVDVRDPVIEARWPMFTQSFDEDRRPGRLLAAPMRPESEVLGVVTMYGYEPAHTAMSPDQFQFLANAIGVAVLGGFERAEDADELWSTRDLINQATGMVVAQLRIGPTDALAVLRAHGFAHDTSLSAIAAQVTSRSLIFSPDPESGTTAKDEAHDD
jgi:hypothetical protein